MLTSWATDLSTDLHPTHVSHFFTHIFNCKNIINSPGYKYFYSLRVFRLRLCTCEIKYDDPIIEKSELSGSTSISKMDSMRENASAVVSPFFLLYIIYFETHDPTSPELGSKFIHLLKYDLYSKSGDQGLFLLGFAWPSRTALL